MPSWMQKASFRDRSDRKQSLRDPTPRRLSRRVLKRCSEAVLRDPETLGHVLRDERSLHMIRHESRLAGQILLDPQSIARVVQDADFLVTLADSEHLLDYLRRHQHLLNRLFDDDELITRVSEHPRFVDLLLRDQATLCTLLDDERTLEAFTRSEARMTRLAGSRALAQLLADQPEIFARLLEIPALQEYVASYPPLLEASSRAERGGHQLRETLLNSPENLERIATDDRTLRKLLEHNHTLDRILLSDRARVRMRTSPGFLDQLIDDPGFVAELFLDPRVVKKLMSNRMLLRGLLQEESIQTAFLECMPTAPTSTEAPPTPAPAPADPESPISLHELLQSPEIVHVFTEDDDLLGCLLQNRALCLRIAEHPVLLRTLDEIHEQDEPAAPPPRTTADDTSTRHIESRALSTETGEPALARQELTRYWNEFIPHLAPDHEPFLTRFQQALGQLETREQIPDTLVQILCDDGDVHLRNGVMSLHAGSKLPEFLYQVLVARRYAFEAETEAPRILDCGAQAGLTTYFFKTLYPRARITAVEPAPNLRQAARLNLKGSGHADIEHLAYALASERGSLPFVLSGDGSGTGALAPIATHEAPAGKTINVRVRPLSDLLRDPVDYLKLDVAGAEVEILASAEPELTNVKQLFVEVHERGDDFPERLAQLFAILKRSGFETRVIAPVGPTPALCGRRPPTGPDDGEVFGVWGCRID